MLKDILTDWNKPNLVARARKEAKLAVEELANNNTQQLPETPPEIMEVLVSKWEDGWNADRTVYVEPKSINLKVRIPVFPDEV